MGGVYNEHDSATRKGIAGIAELRKKVVSGNEIWLKYHTTAGDGGGGLFRGVTGAALNTYIDNNGTIIVPTGGDGSTAWVRNYSGAINAKWFGAVGDGVIDDTQAVQNAIDFCLSFTQAHALRLGGKHRITSSLVVDRFVDTTTSEFLICGNKDSGFFVDSAITIFDSSFTNLTLPQSEFITFQNVNFWGAIGTLAAYVISQKFLRIKFESCYFFKIKCITSTIYLQQWEFLHCNVRVPNSLFFSCQDYCYSLKVENMTFEGVGSGFYVKIARGCDWINNIAEGMTGSFIKIDTSLGVTVVGHYFEANLMQNCIFTNSTGNTSRGVSYIGNSSILTGTNAADVNFYDVYWGKVLGGSSIGNVVNGNLHDDSAVAYGELTSTGDTATVRINRASVPIEALIGITLPRENAIIANPIGGQASAYPITKKINRVTSATPSTQLNCSVSLPPSLATIGQEITIINDATNAIDVFVNPADGTISFTQPAGSTARYISFDAATWRQILETTFATGNTGSILNAVATPLFNLNSKPAGLYTVVARLVAGYGSASMIAHASVLFDGAAASINATDSVGLHISLVGTTVEAWQNSGATQATGIEWSYSIQHIN